jgi:hypothetical protein
MREHVFIAGWLVLSAIPAGHAAVAGDAALVRCEGTGAKADAMTDCSNVATAEKAATYKVHNDDAGAEALEVTARPLAGDPASAYLVQVFVDKDAQTKDTAPELLGSFSFFPARVGQAQTFVLPKPENRGGSSAGDLTLSIKLIPANAAKTLEDTAVEIVGARLVK